MYAILFLMPRSTDEASDSPANSQCLLIVPDVKQRRALSQSRGHYTKRQKIVR